MVAMALGHQQEKRVRLLPEADFVQEIVVFGLGGGFDHFQGGLEAVADGVLGQGKGQILEKSGVRGVRVRQDKVSGFDFVGESFEEEGDATGTNGSQGCRVGKPVEHHIIDLLQFVSIRRAKFLQFLILDCRF
jgi:hypothetical protein